MNLSTHQIVNLILVTARGTLSGASFDIKIAWYLEERPQNTPRNNPFGCLFWLKGGV